MVWSHFRMHGLDMDKSTPNVQHDDKFSASECKKPSLLVHLGYVFYFLGYGFITRLLGFEHLTFDLTSTFLFVICVFI